jgi:ParB/RepB/Spo0J family partition protein
LETVEKAKQAMREQLVQLSLIHSDPIKLRPLDEDRVEDLMASFLSKGQQQAIKIRPDGVYSYMIVFGEHRLEAGKRLAAKGLAIKGLPVGVIRVVIEDVDELEALELKVTENIQRNHFTDPVEEGRAYARLLKERYRNNLNALSDSIGKNTTYIKDRLAVFYQLEPSLRRFIGKELTIGNAIAIAKLQEPEKQLRVAEAVIRTRVRAASTAWGSGPGGGAPPMGTIRVRPEHSCTCDCGDIHPIRNAQIMVDVGEPGVGVQVVLGLVSRDQGYVHVQNPEHEGTSYCGYDLMSHWNAELPERVDTRTFRTGDGYRLCDNCARPWRKARESN